MHTFTYMITFDNGVELTVEQYELEDIALEVWEKKVTGLGIAEAIECVVGSNWKTAEIEIALGNNSQVLDKLEDSEEVLEIAENRAIRNYRGQL